MKHKLSKRLRSIIGISLTLGVFVFILLVLNSWLGWPTSFLTFGGMLVIAWIVSMFAGEQIAPLGLGTVAASCLAVALAVSTIGLGVPWRLGEENVRFDYRATFAYIGNKDNEPLENLFLRFPAPNIDNEAPDLHSPAWFLYYLENDSTLTLQATSTQIHQFRGVRTVTLGIFTQLLDSQTEYGPMVTYKIDQLYQQEIFSVVGVEFVFKNRASDLSLRTYGDPKEWASAYWHTPKFEQENKGINFSFIAALYRENTLVEQFEIVWENKPYGWYALARTV